MMKKLMSLILAGVAVLVLSGCGGGGSNYYYEDDLTTLFLIDQDGFSLGNPIDVIPWLIGQQQDLMENLHFLTLKVVHLILLDMMETMIMIR